MKLCSCLGLLLWLPYLSRAQPQRPVQRLTPGAIPLKGKLFQLVDSTGKLTIQSVMQRQQAGQFRLSSSQTNRQDFGYNATNVHWLFFELEAPADSSSQAGARLMLEIEYANLDELELTEVSNGRIRSMGITGDRFQFSPRPYQNNNYVFPIRLQPGRKTQFYLRVNQPYATLSFAVSLWTRPAFLASDRTEYFLWGIYVGIICIVLVLNMVMLVALRDSIYVWYSLYLHFMTMHLFADSGLGFQYLWPTFPRLNEFWPVYLYAWAATLAQTTFMHYFIGQNRHNSRVFWWITGFKILMAAALIAAILVQLLELPGRETYMFQLVSLGTSYFVPVISVLTIISLYETTKRTKQTKSNPIVRYYGYAVAVQFSGYGLVAFMNFCQTKGWPLPFDVETYVIVSITVLADLVLFTYGLAYRYTQSQQQNQQLELNLLRSREEAQQEVIRSLDTEQQRLAQDLHDDIGPLLATAKGYVSRLARTDQSALLQEAQTLLDEAADELRTLSHQLLPEQLQRTNLADAVAEVTRKTARRGIPVQFVSLGEVRSLGGQREQLLFSIATQLIRNARQRDGVSEVVVQLLYHNDQVNLSVEDNGKRASAGEVDESNLRAKINLLKADLLTEASDGANSSMVNVSLKDAVSA